MRSCYAMNSKFIQSSYNVFKELLDYHKYQTNVIPHIFLFEENIGDQILLLFCIRIQHIRKNI